MCVCLFWWLWQHGKQSLQSWTLTDGSRRQRLPDSLHVFPSLGDRQRERSRTLEISQVLNSLHTAMTQGQSWCVSETFFRRAPLTIAHSEKKQWIDNDISYIYIYIIFFVLLSLSAWYAVKLKNKTPNSLNLETNHSMKSMLKKDNHSWEPMAGTWLPGHSITLRPSLTSPMSMKSLMNWAQCVGGLSASSWFFMIVAS